MVGDGGHAKNDIGIPSSGSNNHYSDEGSAYDDWGVGVDPIGLRDGYLWYIFNQVVYKVEEVNYSCLGVLAAHI